MSHRAFYFSNDIRGRRCGLIQNSCARFDVEVRLTMGKLRAIAIFRPQPLLRSTEGPGAAERTEKRHKPNGGA
jgi:hypothetical protein